MWCGVVGLVLRFLLFPFRDDFQRSVSQQTSFVTAECTISAVAVRYLILPAQSCACISTAWSSPEIDRTNERTGTYLGCWSWENVKTQLSIPPIPTLPRVIFDSGPHHTARNQPSRHAGEAALPLDARVLGVSHPVLLSVKDKQGRSRGFLRVEAFWLDEAKPKKEIGEFYYKVGACSLLAHPWYDHSS